MPGDTALLGFQMQDDGFVIGVLSDDVELTIGVGSELASDFKSEDQVKCISSDDLGLDDAELVGVLLGEQGDFHRKFFLIQTKDQKDESIFARDEEQVRLADVFVVDEDVLSAGLGGAPCRGGR